jgi:hypothetical protein
MEKVMIRIAHGYFDGGGISISASMPNDRCAYSLLARIDRRAKNGRSEMQTSR